MKPLLVYVLCVVGRYSHPPPIVGAPKYALLDCLVLVNGVYIPLLMLPLCGKLPEDTP